jgi:hypothetical protein
VFRGRALRVLELGDRLQLLVHRERPVELHKPGCREPLPSRSVVGASISCARCSGTTDGQGLLTGFVLRSRTRGSAEK